MSFNNKTMSVMAYANGFTLWTYSTSDNLTTVNKKGYFDATAPFVRKGDMIMVVADNQKEIVSPTIIGVTSVGDTFVNTNRMER